LGGVLPCYANAARLCLERGAYVEPIDARGATPLFAACWQGHTDAARLCLAHGADISQSDNDGTSLQGIARVTGHDAMAAWLGRIRRVGWTRYLSLPRYKLVVLRALVARGRATRRQRADVGKEQLLDFLFPSGRPSKRATRHQPCLPDDLFPLVARYYWGGEAFFVAAMCPRHSGLNPPALAAAPRLHARHPGELFGHFRGCPRALLGARPFEFAIAKRPQMPPSLR